MIPTGHPSTPTSTCPSAPMGQATPCYRQQRARTAPREPLKSPWDATVTRSIPPGKEDCLPRHNPPSDGVFLRWRLLAPMPTLSRPTQPEWLKVGAGQTGEHVHFRPADEAPDLLPLPEHDQAPLRRTQAVLPETVQVPVCPSGLAPEPGDREARGPLLATREPDLRPADRHVRRLHEQEPDPGDRLRPPPPLVSQPPFPCPTPVQYDPAVRRAFRPEQVPEQDARPPGIPGGRPLLGAA